MIAVDLPQAKFLTSDKQWKMTETDSNIMT